MREEDVPVGPVVKNPPTKFRRISHATEQLSPSPQLLGLCSRAGEP